MNKGDECFSKYEYGDNSEYKRWYFYANHQHVHQGMCLATSAYVATLASANTIISFSETHMSPEHVYQKIAGMQSRYNSTQGVSNSEYILIILESIKKSHQDNFHRRGRCNDILSTADCNRILKKIVEHRERFPCGIFTVNSPNGGHAFAFCCDSTFFYLFDPNRGFMRFNRSSQTELQPAFDYLVNHDNANNTFGHGYLLYCKHPANVLVPGMF